jgi:hypothetical protein
VRVLSHGDNGSVSQSNDASSDAFAGNFNWTQQTADQSASGGCCGTGIQAIGQSAQNEQGAKAVALTLQLGQKQTCRCNDDPGLRNSSTPIRTLSPGNDGSVTQKNIASSNAVGVNWNWTKQDASQSWVHPSRCLCKKPETGVQAIGQLSQSTQFSGALAATLQRGAANNWGPDRKGSPGDTGSLSQHDRKPANDASGSRTATEQSKTQVRE